MSIRIQAIDSTTGKQLKSSYTLPSAIGVAGKILISDGTNFVIGDAPSSITTPNPSTLNAIPRWGDTVGGELLDSGVLIDGSNNVNIPSNLSVGFSGTAGQAIHVAGNILVDLAGEASVIFKRTATVGSKVNPIFHTGRIEAGGVGLPMWRLLYEDNSETERPVFLVESSGTIASVSDGNRVSHFEGFIQDGDTQPVFRLVSSPDMRLEMGNGGTDNTDVAFVRSGTNQARLDLGGGAKTYWYPDSFVLAEGLYLALNQNNSNIGHIRFYEDPDNGTNYVGLKGGAALGSSLTFTLPVSDATSGFAMTTDGAGQLGFESVVKTAGSTMTGALTLSGEPTNPLHAATKQYVDNKIEGLSPKTRALVATTANITLSGEQTIDGVLTSTSRVLVKDQSTASENGIYVTSSGAWSRASDANTADELISAYLFVEQGSTNGDLGFVCTNDTGFVLDTDPVTFVNFNSTGTGLTGSFSAGQIPYATGATSLTSESNLSYIEALNTLIVANDGSAIYSFMAPNAIGFGAAGNIGGFQFRPHASIATSGSPRVYYWGEDGNDKDILSTDGSGNLTFINPNSKYISKTDSINLATSSPVGGYDLYTVPTGKKLIIKNVIVEMTLAIGVSSEGSIKVHTENGDIFDFISLTGLNSTGETYSVPIYGVSVAAAAGDTISLDIGTQWVATESAIASIYLEGILVDG